MSATLIGSYGSPATARRAVSALEDAGVKREEIHAFLHDGTHAMGDGPSIGEHLRGETSGAGAGGFAGDFVNTLDERGVPRAEAEFYAEHVRRGGGVVVVFTDKHEDETARVLNEHGPVHHESRRAAWKEAGYTGFDRDAPVYTADEVRAERERYTARETGTARAYAR